MQKTIVLIIEWLGFDPFRPAQNHIFHLLPKDDGNYSRILNRFNGNIEENVLICGMFIFSSLQAAIHLGPNYLANLEAYKNTNFEDIQSLFNITQKLILEHSEEILNVHRLESASLSWTRSVLSHDQVIQWTKAKVLMYSDSVLCLVKMNDSKGASERWEGQVEEFKMSLSCKELTGIDGETLEFGCNILPGFSLMQLLHKIQDDLRERNIDLRNSQTGSSSCQCSTTSIGQEKETMKFVFRLQDTGRFSVLETNRSGIWNNGGTIQRCRSSSIQEYQCFESLNSEKNNVRDTIHFNADASNTELLFRIIHSVNQLSVYGALSNWCEQFGLIEEEKEQE